MIETGGSKYYAFIYFIHSSQNLGNGTFTFEKWREYISNDIQKQDVSNDI